MTIWRRINDQGGEVPYATNGWVKIKNIWRRINDSGGEVSAAVNGWVKIRTIWRLQSTGLWIKIFGSNIPNAETANPPSLNFVSPAGFESIDSPFNGDRIYLTRGEWNEQPTKFTMYIQKSSPPYSTWTDLITPVVKEYTNYSNSDASFQVPTSISNRPLISKTDVYNKAKFRGKIKAENDDGEADLNFPSMGIAARYLFNISSFEITDETESALTLSWAYDPSTITVSQIPTYMYSQEIQLYNSAGQPQLPFAEVVSLLDTSTVINLPNNLNPNDSYQWELSIIADDYYRDFTGVRYSSDGPTQELAFIDWQPGIIEDPSITFSNRTKESFSVEWFSTNATSYRVDIKRNSTGASLSGYPVTTTNTSAVLSGLTINALYNISVTALGGNAYPLKESNTITESIRTLNLGIQAILSRAYDATATSFKVDILNYQDISTFDITINCTNGNATRSGSVISVSGVSQNQPSCVSVTTSKINNSDLTAFSYDFETSSESCETTGTWYCVTYVQGTPITCSTFQSPTNVSGNGSGYATACYTTPSCCVSTVYSDWSACSAGGVRTRTKTETFLNCTTTVTTEEDYCWYCTTSVNFNCAGCTQTLETQNISGSGSGYSTSCSTSGYPACQTPCICNSTEEGKCGAWSAWSSCSGGYRSRTRICPNGSVCPTSETQQCWYCTTSVNSNCAGCSQSIEGSNISGSGSGYSTSCSTSGFPACQTPCVCDSTANGKCGAWSAWSSCSGGYRSRTRICPNGSPCETSQTQQCWYCTTSVNSNCAGCSQSIEGSNISGSGSGYSTSCSTSGFPACQTPCVCNSAADNACSTWSFWSACVNGYRTRTRTCPSGSPCSTSETEACSTWYCTTSVNINCAGCSQSVESSNISGSGSGFSTSCSTSGYPACQTPCVCNESACTSWSLWSACSGNSRTRTRTCNSGSPCATSETEPCSTWYCTTSVNFNCAGCSQSVESSNISGSGSGYSTSCSTSGYPACQTPCTCNATELANCSAWSGWSACNNFTQTRTRVCGSGSPCSTVEERFCSTPPSFPANPFFPPFFPPFFDGPFFPSFQGDER